MMELQKPWRLPAALSAGCAICLALAIVKDLPTIQAAKTPLNTSSQLTSNDQPTQISTKPFDAGSTLVASHLFGIAVLVDQTFESLPETELKLELRGTFSSNIPSSASALVAEENGDSRRYFVGDALPGDAELVKVEEELVVIRRNHQDELLRLPRFGDISVGPELSYPDRRVFLEQTNPVSDSPEETADFKLEKNISHLRTDDPSNKVSLQDRLAALRKRYSNQE